MPAQDQFATLLAVSEAAVAGQLARQVLDGPDRDRGGIMQPETRYTDPRGTMFVGNLWLTVFQCPASRYYGDALLADRLVALLDFMRRRQHPDGSIDLGNWRHAPCEVGFTVPAACRSYRLLTTNPDLPRQAEIVERLGGYLALAANALREGPMYTANHRWTPGVAALACVDALFPHPGNLAKIEDYLDDGIDCTHEGIYYAERSPNYNMVANYGLLLAAEKLNRPELLQHVRRNLDFCLAMRNPNGYAESGLSFRQDRGVPKAIFGSYDLYKLMAVQDGNGVWAQAADVLFTEQVEGRKSWGDFIPTLQIFDAPAVREEQVPRQPLPEHFTHDYRSGEIVRVRNGNFAATLKGNGKPYEPTGWGGPVGEANFLALYHGQAAIEAVMVKFGYNPDQAFKPERITRTPDGYLLNYHWQGFPLHMVHRRPGRRDIWMHADFTVTVRVELLARGARLHVTAEGLEHIPVTIELLLDPAGLLVLDGAVTALEPGKRVWCDAQTARYERDGAAFLITPGRCEHRLPINDLQIVTGQAEQRCARLTLGGYAPFHHTLEIQAVEG